MDEEGDSAAGDDEPDAPAADDPGEPDTGDPSESDAGGQIESEAEDPNEPEGDDSTDPEGSVAGPFAPDLPIEPEEIDLINVVFVLIGAYVGMLVIAAIVAPTITPQGRLDALTIAWLTLGFAAVAGLTYAFFARTSAEMPPSNPDT